MKKLEFKSKVYYNLNAYLGQEAFAGIRYFVAHMPKPIIQNKRRFYSEYAVKSIIKQAEEAMSNRKRKYEITAAHYALPVLKKLIQQGENNAKNL